MAVKVYLGRREQQEGEACRPGWHAPGASVPLGEGPQTSLSAKPSWQSWGRELELCSKHLVS